MSFDKSIRPRRETAESKAETTKRISQEITKTEADIRNEKTLRLRAERLAAQESQPEEVRTRAKRAGKSAKPN
ncbi:hypothetical protein [Roseibium aggregatum]|uniref:Uncharacterized protein n=1 Tax=Roseibium aggregatum TaxID=187304 RepID=A0A939ED91_9HYPH|nr:hypothetical protein [Roseibium aggregatum]MBN9669730.1 hypothetical protein [Roseibium aggregatum]